MKSPTIVVGIGGVGSEICAMISKMLPVNASDNAYIKFVVVDTDVNAMRELRRNGFKGGICQISQNMTVDKYLRDEVDGIKERIWYPDSPIFRKKPLTEGAGQMRAIARLALDDAIRCGRMKPLLSAVDDLLGLRGAKDQSLRVYLIGSLEGGTGSGISLYLPMYLEYYYRKKYGDYKTLINGYFLLPSSLESVIRKPGERASVAANAYAALKEIGAFMNCKDGLSGTDANALVMYLADAGSKEYIPYVNSPFEYCYLYEAMDRTGSPTKSYEEMKTVVAKTVYVQACSSMQGKSNSLEDNVKKILIDQMNSEEELTIRRFGGAGYAELLYPYELLKQYYAMTWAKDVMNDQWKKYDAIYWQKKQEYLENKKKGMRVAPVDRKTEYIIAIETADRTDVLADMIKTQCGVTSGNEIWRDYLQCVKDEIARNFNEIWKGMESKISYNDLRIGIDSLVGGKAEKSTREKSAEIIKKCFDEIKKEAEEIPAISGKYLSDYLFGLHPAQADRSKWEMERVLTVSKEFAHPNAVRYFLYKLSDAINAEIQALNKAVKKEEEKYNNDALHEEKKLKQLGEVYKTALEGLRAGMLAKLTLNCLAAGLIYVDDLTEQYENFYDKYDELIEEFSERISDIEAELDGREAKNKVVSYICTDKLCREKEWGWMENASGFFNIGSGVSTKIFELMHDDWNEEAARKASFSQLKEYWLESWENEFKGHFDNDVLTMLRREMEYKGGSTVFADEIIQELQTTLDDCAAPRLKSIKSEVPHEMQICCYNQCLTGLKGEYEKVLQWLREHSGVEEDIYCNKYQLIFYSSFLGIDYYQVQEFEHDKGNKLYTGYNYDHYKKAIGSIQTVNGNPISTPHIDKHWHNCIALRDSDKKEQKRLEKEALRAFLVGRNHNRFIPENGKFYFDEAREAKFMSEFQLYQALYENPLWIQKLNLLKVRKDTDNLFTNFGEFFLNLTEKERAVLDLYCILDICKELYEEDKKTVMAEDVEAAAMAVLKNDYNEFKERCQEEKYRAKIDESVIKLLNNYFED